MGFSSRARIHLTVPAIAFIATLANPASVLAALPVSSGLNLHFDAADSSTIFDASNNNPGDAGFDGTVVRWNDLSGNGIDMTTVGNDPGYNATGAPSGLPTVKFTGNNSLMAAGPLDGLPTIEARTIFFAGRQTGNTATFEWYFSYGYASPGEWNVMMMYEGAVKDDKYENFFVGAGAAELEGTAGYYDVTSPPASPTIVEVEYDGTGTYQLHHDGTFDSSISTIPLSTNLLHGAYLGKGELAAAADKAEFDMYELILYDRVLSDVERGLVGDYLSNKWNITSAYGVPSTHDWNLSGSGNFNSSGSWSPSSVPNSTTAFVNFGSAITGPATVTLTSPVTLSGIGFDNVNSVTLAGSSANSVTMNAVGSTVPTILAIEGLHSITAPVNLSKSSEVIVSGGAELTLNNNMNLNNHTLSLTDSGTVNVNGTVTTGASGMIKVNAGVFRGTGTVVGKLTNAGGTLNPGLSPGKLNVTGDFLQTSGSLIFEINNTVAETGYDVLNVTGDLTISGGSLDIALGFVPVAGNSFDIMNFSSAKLSGVTFNLPALASNLNWNTTQLDVDGTLSVDYIGDFNGDTQIDLADYAVMKTYWLSTGNDFNYHGELTGDGIVNLYDFKKFKEQIYPGGLSAFERDLAAVPEPVTFLLFLVGAPACLLTRFRGENDALAL